MDKTNHLTYKNPIIALGLHIPGMFILKHSRKLKIDVYGLDIQKEIGFFLRKSNCSLCPDPDTEENKWIEFMEKFGSNFQKKPVLMVTSDKFIDCITKYKNRLRKFFIFHETENDIAAAITNKKNLYKIACEKNVRMPLTFFPRSGEDLQESIDAICYPCIIKPLISKKWWEPQLHSMVGWNKVILVRTKEELLQWFNRISVFDNDLMVQEVIPGPDQNLYYFVCYLDRNSDCLSYFTGQKIRISPIHFGHATYVKTVNDNAVKEIAVAFLKKINYWGPCGIEFKRDEKTGEYKLVEINPRISLWDSIGIKLGIDIADVAYRDLLGQKIIPITPLDKTVYWAEISSDVNAFFDYHSEKLITFRNWLLSLAKVRMFGDIYVDEPGVLYHITIGRLIKKIHKAIKKALQK